MLNDKLGGGGRSLHSCVRDEVDDGVVPLVSYASDDRQRKLSYVLCQFEAVKSVEVRCRATTSGDDHYVP